MKDKSMKNMGASLESNNAFVKKTQMSRASMSGKDPRLDAKYKEYNQEMISDGAHAQALTEKLTASFDKTAFPVK